MLIKEPLFGVFYILSEGSSHGRVSRWEVRWGLFLYLIDFGQVKLVFMLKSSRPNIFTR